MSDPCFQRERCLTLLEQYTQSPALRKHALAVEAAMGAAAQKTGNAPEYWQAVGLLHDFDYERFPEAPDHPLKGAEILRENGFEEDFIRTILSHAPYTGVPRESACARWLFAVDELCGFCMACAMVQPDKKIASVQVKSVLKKLKRKEFAAKVSREDIFLGAAELGLPLEQLIAHVLEALTGIADRLEL